MEVHVLEALSDNYMYLIVDPSTKKAAVVDPADPKEVVAAAARLGVQVTTVLTTHHHYDHAGGNAELARLVPGLEVIGGEPVQAMTRQAKDGDIVEVGAVKVRCLHTPCHTQGHMSYVASGPTSEHAAVFTGDILFVGGCGRFFEGTPEQMLAASKIISALPAGTAVYCGHEYTVKNLQFALAVEPKNKAAQDKIMWAQDRRAKGEFTVPSTIGEELAFNPFMRVGEPTVRAFTKTADDTSCMRVLRNKKDSFAGSSRPWIPGGGPLPGL